MPATDGGRTLANLSCQYALIGSECTSREGSNQLGHRFRNFSGNTYYPAAADSRTKIQAGIQFWGHDYPSAGDFFSVFTCESFTPNSSSNANWAEFCNPKIDAEIARARTLQITDPGAASRLWARIDRDVVNQAPFFFLQNPLQVDFVSRRVGNYQYNPQWGVLLDQLWVR